MTEKPAEKKHLPTGDEPPKGYEALSVNQEDNGFKVSYVMFNHLARSEHAEIEALRKKALEVIDDYQGLTNEPLSLGSEVNIIKDADDENKMLALVYIDKKLVGYSLVIEGWPQPSKWLIQHMIIDPDMRRQGIGTAIVHSIEQYALESEVAADAVYAIPLQESSRKFWQELGYTVEVSRLFINLADTDQEFVVYCKALD